MITTVVRAMAIVVAVASTAGANPDGRAPSSSVTASARDNFEYILLLDDNHMTMSGSTRDLKKVRGLRHGNERVLWIRAAGKEWVIRDVATIQQAMAVWKPVNELGEAQGELGRQQGGLGARQGAIGARQGALGARQGELATREAALELRAETGSLSAAEAQQLATDRRELRKQMRALERDMRSAEAPMKDLEGQMEVLGRQMELLGNKMEAASRKATAEMRVIIDRAIASGTAALL